MEDETVLYLVDPDSRPPFGLVADHLWGADANIDSDGDSRFPNDSEWTELFLLLRGAEEVQHVQVDPVSTAPLVLQIRSPVAELTEKTASFLSGLTGGRIERVQPLYRPTQ